MGGPLQYTPANDTEITLPGQILISAGEFYYGEERAVCYLPEFWIDRFPVTNRQYARFVAAAGHWAPAHWKDGRPPEALLDHPVVNVFFEDATAYADWAGGALPTELEWEKAARGIHALPFPWGFRGPTAELCNFNMNVGDTTPVGAYSPAGDSPYGVSDMSGNVWEWTNSWFDDDCRYRVLRGGAYRYRAQDASTICRLSILPGSCYNDVGFRLVSRLKADLPTETAEA